MPLNAALVRAASVSTFQLSIAVERAAAPIPRDDVQRPPCPFRYVQREASVRFDEFTIDVLNVELSRRLSVE